MDEFHKGIDAGRVQAAADQRARSARTMDDNLRKQHKDRLVSFIMQRLGDGFYAKPTILGIEAGSISSYLNKYGDGKGFYHNYHERKAFELLVNQNGVRLFISSDDTVHPEVAKFVEMDLDIGSPSLDRLLGEFYGREQNSAAAYQEARRKDADQKKRQEIRDLVGRWWWLGVVLIVILILAS